MDVLIPSGYNRIALSEFRYNSAAAFYNKDSNKFFFIIDEKKALGPIEAAQLEVLHHVMTDVKEMRGRYGAV